MNASLPSVRPEVAYVLSSTGIGGGNAIVFRHVYELNRRGRPAAVFAQNLAVSPSWWYLADHIRVYPLEAYSNVCGPEGAEHLVATFWKTALTVASLPARRRHYFLQSLEYRFYPEGHPYQGLFFLTLFLGLDVFTEARWIQAWLQQNLGLDVPSVRNGVDGHRFFPPAQRPERQRLRVLVEGPSNLPYKGVQFAFEALHDLPVEVWYVSSGTPANPAWRLDRFLGAVPFGDMPDVYRACDVLLKLSTVEGLFCPPLEMMACGGTCVVSDVSGHEEFCRHESNCLVVPRGDVRAARAAVQRLDRDRDLLRRLRDQAIETARQWTWDEPAEQLVREIFAGPPRRTIPVSPEIQAHWQRLKQYIDQGLEGEPRDKPANAGVPVAGGKPFFLRWLDRMHLRGLPGRAEGPDF